MAKSQVHSYKISDGLQSLQGSIIFVTSHWQLFDIFQHRTSKQSEGNQTKHCFFFFVLNGNLQQGIEGFISGRSFQSVFASQTHSQAAIIFVNKNSCQVRCSSSGAIEKGLHRRSPSCTLPMGPERIDPTFIYRQIAQDIHLLLQCFGGQHQTLVTFIYQLCSQISFRTSTLFLNQFACPKQHIFKNI